MADLELNTDLKSLRNSKIVVSVDEVLQDILVVSYAVESRLYQGVLLDSTKRQLPCGITGPPNFLNQLATPKLDNSEEDKFFSISQRFTYFQDKGSQVTAAKGSLLNHFHVPRAIKPTPRLKGARMTVRLRPRQVLCSKCRSICNENSENVDHSSGRKKMPPFTENQCNNVETRDGNCPTERGPSLIPRLSRLKPNEISSAINGKVPSPVSIVNKPPSLDVNYWLHSDNATATPAPDIPISDDVQVEEDMEGKMVLRKKRSIGSMEDLWDESVFEEKRARTTPVIKISFGSQGEGEVLKIPSKLQNCSESETEDKQKAASAKAAKRALKKAKKEARRKVTGPSTPNTSPIYEALHYRRHRHKVKHKKKHKEERLTKDDIDIKERCLKQKLSISLRRLNATAYTSKREEPGSSPATSHTSEEVLPDFPPSPPIPLDDPVDIGSKVSSIHTSEGRVLAVGDIVWGKIHGFPWWPGKVLSISVSEEGSGTQQAHVAWYGSSTSSLMPCDQLSPFLETFKSRYNKKKKSGQYKEAIRQATTEASGSQSSTQALVSPSEPLPALPLINASPTQVHVVS